MGTSTSTDFMIFTSIRSDGILRSINEQSSNDPDEGLSQFYMLKLHQERLLTAMSAFEWPQEAQGEILNLKKHLLAHLASAYGNTSDAQPLKIRFAVSYTGDVETNSVSVPELDPISLYPTSLSILLESPYINASPNYRVFLSASATTPSKFTAHKTTSRAQYENVRGLLPQNKIPLSDEAPLLEILLFNHNGEIMEGTITTPYFYRGGTWITPAAGCGGNLGTTRRYALERSLCKEGLILKHGVNAGEKLVLSNGARGFGWGIVEELYY